MNEANYGKCRDLSVIWEFSKFMDIKMLASYVGNSQSSKVL